MAKPRRPVQWRGFLFAIILGCAVVLGFALFQRPGADASGNADPGQSVVPRRTLADAFANITGRDRGDSEARGGAAGGVFQYDATDRGTRRRAKGGAIVGYPKVLSATRIELEGVTYDLWGVRDVPSWPSACYQEGRAYECNALGAFLLTQYIGNHLVACYPQGAVRNQHGIASCFKDQMSLAGYLVRGGYAVSNLRLTKNYYASEVHARDNRLGVWSGGQRNQEQLLGSE